MRHFIVPAYDAEVMIDAMEVEDEDNERFEEPGVNVDPYRLVVICI